MALPVASVKFRLHGEQTAVVSNRCNDPGLDSIVPEETRTSILATTELTKASGYVGHQKPTSKQANMINAWFWRS